MTGLPLKKKLGVIAAVILVAGLIRMPLETSMLKSLREDGFHPKYNEISGAEQIGVKSSIAVLGGLRYMVATYFEFKALHYWEYRKWDELAEAYQFITLLQPRDPESWMNGSAHLVYDAHAWYSLDDKEHSDEVRQYLTNLYLDRGLEMLERGTKWCPDNPWLYRNLGQAYREKKKDKCKAAYWFKKGSEIDQAPAFLRRFYAYNLADCPGNEKEAYELAMEIYEEGKQVYLNQGVMIWMPTLIITIKELEEFLGVPREQRIPETVDLDRLRINTPLKPKVRQS